MRDHLLPPPYPKKTAAPLLISLCPLSFLFPALFINLSSPCLTALNCHSSSSYLFSFRNRGSPLPWQQSQIIKYLLGWEEMCWFFYCCEAGLHVVQTIYSLTEKIWETFISVMAFKWMLLNLTSFRQSQHMINPVTMPRGRSCPSFIGKRKGGEGRK